MSIIKDIAIRKILASRNPERIGKLLGLLYKEIVQPTKAMREFTKKVMIAFEKEARK